MSASDLLKTYRAKRNFSITPEPDDPDTAVARPAGKPLVFVIQKHWATRLHYDFRLELDGAMKSWAVPKGPSYDMRDKRMAVQVEDHPISYNKFEGQIPEKQYGAGKVIIWDKGVWIPIGDPEQGYRDGNLKFEMQGHKMRGKWALIRMKARDERKPAWLLIKERDDYVRPAEEFSVVDEMPDSVAKLGDAPASTAKASSAGKPAAAAKTAKAAPVKAKPGKSADTAPVKAAKAAKASKAVAAVTAVKAGKPVAQTKDTPVKRKRASKAALPADARKADLPETFSPQLATLVDGPPANSEDWEYEIKFDGYRLLARIDGKDIKLFTRNGHDWSAKLPALAKALGKLKLPSAWLDGEIIVNNAQGTPDFQALQNAFDSARTASIGYYLFDLPFYDGHDLRGVALEERRALLQGLLKDADEPLRFSETFSASAQEVLTSACQIGLEGVIGKRKGSSYVSRRSADWIKLKCLQRQEFVIGGYTDPQGARTGFGSLLLGVHDDKGALQYAGNVGTGFDNAVLDSLYKKLKALDSADCPFASRAGIARKVHWVKPTLLAEISFAAWTDKGHVRHGVFQGLRADKPAKGIVRELPQHLRQPAASATTSSSKKTSASAQPAGTSDVQGTLPASLKVSHPERVIDAESGVTKIQLIRFYALVAPLMLPHLKGRPTSLVRAPDGIAGQLFFQKHAEHSRMDGVTLLDQALDPGHPPLLEIASAQGLLSAAQMNVVEFHTWNGVRTAIAKPDRMTFDMDPGDGVEWAVMQESTLLMKQFLEQLGLRSFVKTSGGKGMHVVVPLKKQHDWDTVKDFSHAIVDHLAATLPMRFVAKSGPRNRVGKIFIDYLRNGFGATTACAWSARARPGMGVSVPLAWDEVGEVGSGAQWTVTNIHERLDVGNGVWEGYEGAAQSVTAAMKVLGFKPVAGGKKK